AETLKAESMKLKGSKKRSLISPDGERWSDADAKPGRKISFDAVRRLAVALPEVEEGTTYGSPAFKVRGKLLACVAIHKSAEPDSLAVRIPYDLRADLIASEPETYYLTDHYIRYPVVLVRLSRVNVKRLRALLEASWRFVSREGSENEA